MGVEVTNFDNQGTFSMLQVAGCMLQVRCIKVWIAYVETSAIKKVWTVKFIWQKTLQVLKFWCFRYGMKEYCNIRWLDDWKLQLRTQKHDRKEWFWSRIGKWKWNNGWLFFCCRFQVACCRFDVLKPDHLRWNFGD